MSISNSILKLNESLSSILTRWIAAFLILLIGLIIGKLVGRFTKKLLNRLKLNQIIEKSTGASYSIEEILSLSIEYFIYFIAVIFALDQLSISTTILNIISGALVVFILISILLAIKDVFPNVVAGIYILNKFKLKPGEKIAINGVKGKIKEISLMEIQIATKDKEIAYIPNANFLKKNWKLNN